MRGPSRIPETVGLPGALPALARSLAAHRFILRSLVRNEVLTRYSHTLLGVAWSLLNPLAMLLVYSFVFGVVFQVRFGRATPAGEVPYGIVLFSGLLAHMFLAETLNRAQGVVLENANYVKRVIFPLEVLPVGVAAANLVHAGVALLVLLAAILATGHSIPPTALLLPAVWAPFAAMVLGLAMFVASLGVFVRDIGQVLGFVTTVLLFLSPILFPADMLPAALRDALVLNPLTVPVEQTRAVLLWGEAPDWRALGGYALAGAAMAWTGSWWFLRTRKGFADVM